MSLIGKVHGLCGASLWFSGLGLGFIVSGLGFRLVFAIVKPKTTF